MYPESVSASSEPVYMSAGQQILSPLSKICAVALFGNGLAYLCAYLVAIIAVGLNWVALLPILVFVALSWITAGLVLKRIPWASTASAVVGFVTPAIYLAIPATRSGLLHPANSPLHFGLLIVTFTFGLSAIISGIAARRQHSPVSAQPAPRWFLSLLSGVAGLAVGMIVIAYLAGAHPLDNSTQVSTNGIPTVHMVGGNFQTNVVLVPKGGRLLLTDDDGVEHILQNGSWTTSGTPQPQTEAGAPVVHSRDIKSGSITVGPFNNAGLFHIYCPIHRGMNLTVVVQ